MTDVQNKQPQTAKERLASISHHFLSNDDIGDDQVITEEEVAGEVSEEAWDVVGEIITKANDTEESAADSSNEAGEQPLNKAAYTLALLKTTKDHDELPVFLLSQQLAASGHASAILDCDTGNMVSYLDDPQQTRTVQHGLDYNTLEDATRRLGDKPHDVHFLLVDSPQATCLSTVDRILVSTPATAEGLQCAYSAIKQLTAHHDSIQVGVTITGTTDALRAEGYFNRLATAVHQFLDRDLLSYGFLPAHTTLLSINNPGIATVAEIISAEISEWQQNDAQVQNCNKIQAGKPALANEEMNLNLKSVTITSDDELLELVTDALPDILGDAYEIVNNELPFTGNHILVLDGKKQPFVISFDKHDGTHALMSGLSVLEGLSRNQAKMQRLQTMINRLHPDADSDSHFQFRIDRAHLIVLSPNPPAGGTYLGNSLNNLSFYTFHALQVDDRTGLLIEPCITRPDNGEQQQDTVTNSLANAFRGGKSALSREESVFFQDI